MLNASPEYEVASKGGANGEDAVKVYTRTLLYREFNNIVDNPVVTVDPAPIDPRFGGENVLNSRNPEFRGISFGPLDEFYFSSDPTYGYRFINNAKYDDEREVAYFIPQDLAGGETYLAEVIIDYGAPQNINGLQVRYDHTKKVDPTPLEYDYDLQMAHSLDGVGYTTVYNGPTNDDGKTEIFYNGTNWDEGSSRVNGSTVSARYVLIRFLPNTDVTNPRVMYFGAMHVVELDDDILDLSVSKSEFEHSTYLPYGESTTNDLSLTLDNTAGIYRYGNGPQQYFQKYQRITTEFGFDVSRYGGTGIEYVPGGEFFIEDFDYSESEMTCTVSGSDYSMFLKERMCENVIWRNKSIKYIIKDVLARAGFSPKFCIFNFGVTGNVNETNLKPYVWAHDEQTVWDFISTLIKSELGNVYFNEEGRLVVTDREYFRTSIDNGSVDVLTADVDIESLSEMNVIDANKIRVRYSDINAASTNFNPSLIATSTGTPKYVNLGPRYKPDVVWSPSDDTFLGSAGLAVRLTPTSTHIYCPVEDANQISEDEGMVRIGRELIKYDQRTVTASYLKLRIVERGAYGTPINGTVARYQDKPPMTSLATRDTTMTNVSANISQSFGTTQGLRLRQIYASHWGKGRWRKYFIRPDEMSSTTNYDLYGLSFTFNKIPEGYQSHQGAGLFMNFAGDVCFYFEVNKFGLSEDDEVNMVAYKSPAYMQHAVPMPPFPASHTKENKILFAESQTIDGVFKLGTPIEILVYNNKSSKELSWYVNGNLVASTSTQYSRFHPDIFTDLTTEQGNTLNHFTRTGKFGVYTHGSTDITVDYLFATNKDQFTGYDILRPYNRATNSFERDYLPEEFTGFYEEFGGIVHEVSEFEAGHSTFPNLNPMILNTLEHKLHIHYQSHSPFDSKIIVSNNDRYGVNINGTNFSADGTQLTSGFFVYAIPIITEHEDQIEVVDTPAVRKYGPSEVEIDNEWIDSKGLARSLANSIKAQWAEPVSFFVAEWFPNPQIQPGDRVGISFPEKGFDNTDIWIVTGSDISYDGGLSGTLTLKRYESAPPVPGG